MLGETYDARTPVERRKRESHFPGDRYVEPTEPKNPTGNEQPLHPSRREKATNSRDVRGNLRKCRCVFRHVIIRPNLAT